MRWSQSEFIAIANHKMWSLTAPSWRWAAIILRRDSKLAFVYSFILFLAGLCSTDRKIWLEILHHFVWGQSRSSSASRASQISNSIRCEDSGKAIATRWRLQVSLHSLLWKYPGSILILNMQIPSQRSEESRRDPHCAWLFYRKNSIHTQASSTSGNDDSIPQLPTHKLGMYK